MKKIGYEVVENINMVVTIRITDDEAGKIARMREFSGFGLKDAIRQANKRLKNFGYEIA